MVSDWSTTEVEVMVHDGRDHQVVNEHKCGTIRVHASLPAHNTRHTVFYGYASRDGKKLAWFLYILDPGKDRLEEKNEMYDDVIYDIDEAHDLFRGLADPEVEWLGFEIVDEPPEWHYTEERDGF